MVAALGPVGSPTGLLLYVTGIDQIIQRPAYRAHGQLCIPADRADGGEAFPLPVRTAAQIHVYRHSPAGQVIRPNSIEPAAHTFSCIIPGFCRSGNRSCPGTICCPGGIPYSFSIFLLNSLLPAYFTSRCACCSNAYGSVNVMPQSRNSRSLDSIGRRPVFITINCPFGIDFSSSGVISRRPIICRLRE